MCKGTCSFGFTEEFQGSFLFLSTYSEHEVTFINTVYCGITIKNPSNINLSRKYHTIILHHLRLV